MSEYPDRGAHTEHRVRQAFTQPHIWPRHSGLASLEDNAAQRQSICRRRAERGVVKETPPGRRGWASIQLMSQGADKYASP
jgi:hypothetical protein